MKDGKNEFRCNKTIKPIFVVYRVYNNSNSINSNIPVELQLLQRLWRFSSTIQSKYEIEMIFNDARRRSTVITFHDWTLHKNDMKSIVNLNV